jgi:NADH dehydrogenase
MSTKRIIILGGGFGAVKCAETLRDELPLDQAEVVPFSRENPFSPSVH